MEKFGEKNKEDREQSTEYRVQSTENREQRTENRAKSKEQRAKTIAYLSFQTDVRNLVISRRDSSSLRSVGMTKHSFVIDEFCSKRRRLHR